MPKDTANIIIFVNAMRPATLGALELHKEKTGEEFEPIILVDSNIEEEITKRNNQMNVLKKVRRISADFDSPHSIRKAIDPIKDQVYAITSQYENSVHELKKLIPYFPYLTLPTESSMDWATDKTLMREHLHTYNPSLVPAFIEITDDKDETILKIEDTVPYPMIVKPSGLEGSLLVTKVHNREELIETLEKTFRGLQDAYDKWIKRQTPTILVEEFMDGDMYSVDTYVSSDGTFYSTPVIKVVTGRKAGFEDFFGYKQMIPSGLSDAEAKKAQIAAEQACEALHLRSVTGHVELMKTDSGWKIIELGPRMGGYRQDLYSLAYDINHIVNDILIRADETPVIPTEIKKNTVMFNVYAREEGILDNIDDIEKVKKLPSLVSITQNTHIGEKALFAKHNGDPVFVIMLSHEDEEQFAKDVAFIENIHIGVVPLSEFDTRSVHKQAQS